MNRSVNSRRTDLFVINKFLDRIIAFERNAEIISFDLVTEVLSFDPNSNEDSNQKSQYDWYKMILSGLKDDSKGHLLKHLEKIAESLSSLGFSVAELFFRLDSQGLVGSGGGVFKPIFEVGLTVDPVLGVPYYPGSGIKGAVRSLTSELYGEDVEKILFGYSAGKEGSAGHVFFSDMYPVGCSRDKCSIFRGLVVNPHYYKGGEPVEDELQVKTNPAVHIGISEGLVFGLVIGTRPINDDNKREKLVDKLKKSSEGGVENAPGLPGLIKLLVSSDSFDLTTIISLLTMETLSKGIAARSNKGYNVFTPVETFNHQFKIVGYRVKTNSSGSGRNG